MYYKIENKDCEVYKKLHAMRTEELAMEKENKALVTQKIGFEFTHFMGNPGQQNFFRTSIYRGFKPDNAENIDLKVWKSVGKDGPAGFYEPNRKTKAGREMAEFLLNGLKKSSWEIPLEILGLPHVGRFVFPYVEIKGDVIVLYLDKQHEPADPNIIEITKREFEAIQLVEHFNPANHEQMK